jgi:hypothetical protein
MTQPPRMKNLCRMFIESLSNRTEGCTRVEGYPQSVT